MNEVLEVSKDLIEQMDDEDAVFIKSECRLLTRGYLQLEHTLKGRIEHMQVRVTIIMLLFYLHNMSMVCQVSKRTKKKKHNNGTIKCHNSSL